MTIDEANRQLVSALNTLYDERESAAICSMVMEKITGISKSLRVIHRRDEFSSGQLILFRRFLDELMRHRPVQYVLGETWFSGLRFFVNEQVLIPRPETEELVNWVLDEFLEPLPQGFRALDIGTGSGCIPIAIGKKRPGMEWLAGDVSPAALDIAGKNSADNEVQVKFFLFDLGNRDQWNSIPDLHLMVSNPPYIPEAQKMQLDPHVRFFEPELALFVPDADPIIYYKLIGEFAKKKLAPAGKIFLELHHDFARNVLQWYKDNGFSAEMRSDFAGKDRMLCAQPLLLHS